MKIAIVLGTRPEIIKMSPIIRECERRKHDYFVLHSGQHYSYEMDRVFFKQLCLPDAKYNLDVGSGSHGEQTGRMLIGMEIIMLKEKPDVVLVEGDTNTVLAGALAAVKLNISVGHVEAGLRSYDRCMPEEINRILTDHSSDFLFAPTEESKQTLLCEGLPEEKIYVTGNTIVDSVFQHLDMCKNNTILQDLGLNENDYFLVTIHRQENVDHKACLRNIAVGLERLQKEFGVDLIYPIHPRTRKSLRNFGIELHGVTLIEPLDYLSFLHLENNAQLVLTDSGGVQEEACILKIPCVTLRDNTERPETIKVGSNILAGANSDKIIKCVKIMNANPRNWDNPYGDGQTSKRILEQLVIC